MRYIFCLLWIFLSATLCGAQRITFNKGNTVSKNYYAEIPYEFMNGYLYVTAEINGVKRRFLFDTGAPVQITSELFKELQPDVVNTIEVNDVSGNKEHLDMVTLKEIKLQGLSFTGIPALVANSEIYACMHIEGIIGSNLLRNSIVRIEPGRHVIILTDDETKLPLNKKNAVPLVIGEPQSYPYFMMGITPKKSQLIGFDSGSPYFLVMAESHAKPFVKDNTFEKVSSGYGTSSRGLLGLQKKDSLYRLKLPSITIAGSVFTNLITETNKSNKTRLGTKILDHGIVTIDFINHFFYFEPTTENNDLGEKLWPLKPIVSDNKLIIGVVWEKLKGQVNAEDQILAMDDVTSENMDLCEWLNTRLEQMMNKQTTILTIKDKNGSIRKVEIVKD
ncbi:retropepsin-like aspartic protease [Flavitalea flava]